MIENLKDELYQLENKQTKDAKLGASLLLLIVGGRGVKMKILGKNYSTSFNYYKRMTWKNSHTIRYKDILDIRYIR